MTGTLLGGFRVWLQDGCGQPLSAPGGRASFFKAGTSVPSSEPLEVYNSADMDVPLGTVVPTDAHGYLPDIWLRSDYLYDIKVERRVQADPELWETLYEVKNVGRIIDEKAESYYENSTIVDNITTLKTVDTDKYYGVYVAGYYDANDWGEPALFVFDENCSKTSNDGSYVRPNSITSDSKKGRWVQQFNGDTVDVRRFGALPDVGEEYRQDVVSKIVNCITYCMDATEHDSPLTVGFLAPGNYYVSGKLDLSYYKSGDKYIHYIINDGVVFNGYLESATEVDLGANTDCLSQSSLVAGYAELVVPSYMTRVDTRWFGETESPVLNGITMRYSGRRHGSSDNDFEFNMTDGTFTCCRLSVDKVFIDDNSIYWLDNNELTSIISFDKNTANFGVSTANWNLGEYLTYVNSTRIAVAHDVDGGSKTYLTSEKIYTDGNLEVKGSSSITGNETVSGNVTIGGNVSAGNMTCSKILTSKDASLFTSNISVNICRVSECTHRFDYEEGDEKIWYSIVSLDTEEWNDTDRQGDILIIYNDLNRKDDGSGEDILVRCDVCFWSNECSAGEEMQAHITTSGLRKGVSIFLVNIGKVTSGGKQYKIYSRFN